MPPITLTVTRLPLMVDGSQGKTAVDKNKKAGVGFTGLYRFFFLQLLLTIPLSSFTSCSGPTYGTAGRTVGCMGKHPSHRPHLLLNNINPILSVFTRSVKKPLKSSS